MQILSFFSKRNIILGTLMFFTMLGAMYQTGILLTLFFIDVDIYDVLIVDPEMGVWLIVIEPFLNITFSLILYRFTSMTRKTYTIMILVGLAITIYYFTAYYLLPEIRIWSMF